MFFYIQVDSDIIYALCDIDNDAIINIFTAESLVITRWYINDYDIWYDISTDSLMVWYVYIIKMLQCFVKTSIVELSVNNVWPVIPRKSRNSHVKNTLKDESIDGINIANNQELMEISDCCMFYKHIQLLQTGNCNVCLHSISLSWFANHFIF